ncbi:CheY chemotaxis protein or a CheY-like REC (receiver) domain [Cyclonatronum proteinivorum]|uniref:CheY chemotaxis protein or a CheY-like REC (Receiver) domain n=1 Tax=Cyclonatronum proteinivorum TaxID=1457365 RepID=A0A345UHC3_9BACT|nr:response regulator [Cyclonatronum proteinivorum]AXI99874.1 CheY chemotaxis protein or a CheY-like REC (receiver) domain [Cyclonatronum proteinivorum]
MRFEVLVIDDDQITLMLHKTLVSRAGLHNDAKKFLNGKLALDHIIENDADDIAYLALLDINMPVMDGWGFMDGYLAANLKSKLYVVMITSSVDNPDRERAESYPMVIDYFTKPVVKEQVAKLSEHEAIKPLLSA